MLPSILPEVTLGGFNLRYASLSNEAIDEDKLEIMLSSPKPLSPVLLLMVYLTVAAVCSVPNCFRYRTEYLVQSTSSGSIDILLTVETDTLIADGKVQYDCANIRFRQQGGSWLDFWWESGCNEHTASRVWLRPEFSGSDVIIEMFYGCREANGGLKLPSTSYGSELTWDGEFLVLTNYKCTWPWIDMTSILVFSDRFIVGVNSLGRGIYGGMMNGHRHTSSGVFPNATEDVSYLISAVASTTSGHFAAAHGHTHTMQEAVVSDGVPSAVLPPWRHYAVCASPKFDLQQRNIVMLNGSYSGLSANWRRFSDGDGFLLRGGTTCNEGQCSSGGSTSHSHEVSGSIGYPDAAELTQIGGGSVEAISGIAHLHQFGAFTTSAASNLPPHIPTVLAEVTHSNGALPFDYSSGQLMVFSDSIPPLGWRSNAEYHRAYIMGSPNKAPIVAAEPHVHTGVVSVSPSTASGTDLWADKVGLAEVSVVGHRHINITVVSDDSLSQYDTDRVEIGVIYYKEGFEQDGVTIVAPEMAYDCGGIFWEDSELVCSGGRGICDPETGNCSCEDDAEFGDVYFGDYCEFGAECGGLRYDNATVCSGFGNCTAGDGCVCDAGHQGALCATPLFFGVPSTDVLNVCGGHGLCMDAVDPYCDCTSLLEYAGVDCSIPVCFGLLATDAGVCNQTGSCVAHDLCVCEDDRLYAGPNCDVPVCNGVPETEAGSCNWPFGQCTAPDVCVCLDDALVSGQWCDEAVVDGTEEDSASPTPALTLVFFVALLIGIAIVLVVVIMAICVVVKQRNGCQSHNEAIKEETDESFDLDFETLELVKRADRVGGGCAVVYKAKWKGAIVAAKVFTNPCLGEPDQGAIRNEMKIASGLRHPNLLPVFHVCFRPPRFAIIMEWAERGDMADLVIEIKAGFVKLSLLDRLQMISGVARALRHLHESGIMHRDVKPQNVLLNAQLVPKLCDYGHSRTVDSREPRRYTGNVGTKFFVAPEVLRSSPYDMRADIFSFAMTMYSLMFLRSEVEFFNQDAIADNLHGLMVANCQGWRPKIPLVSDVTADVVGIITDCWAELPDNRPDCDAIVTRLDAICAADDSLGIEVENEGSDVREGVEEDDPVVIAAPDYGPSRYGRPLPPLPNEEEDYKEVVDSTEARVYAEDDAVKAILERDAAAGIFHGRIQSDAVIFRILKSTITLERPSVHSSSVHSIAFAAIGNLVSYSVPGSEIIDFEVVLGDESLRWKVIYAAALFQDLLLAAIAAVQEDEVDEGDSTHASLVLETKLPAPMKREKGHSELCSAEGSSEDDCVEEEGDLEYVEEVVYSTDDEGEGDTEEALFVLLQRRQ